MQTINSIPADQTLTINEQVNPSVKDTPAYQPGSDSGLYLWKTFFVEPYHLRSSSANAGQYQVRLLSTENILSESTHGLTSKDEFQSRASEFELATNIQSVEKGVDFSLQAGARALLSVTMGGVANPHQLHVDSAAKPLTPVGWIVKFSELPDIQNCQQISPPLLSIYIGRDNTTSSLISLWHVDENTHTNTFAVIAEHNLSTLQGQGINGGDRIDYLSTDITQEFVLSSTSQNEWQGLSAGVSSDSSLGLIYLREGLFPVKGINSGVNALEPNGQMFNGLGEANAYLLLQASPYGNQLSTN